MDVAQYGGRIVNPVQAQGQIAGGSLMGLGFALSESLDYTDGQPANGDWGAYLIPTLADAPLVNCQFPDLLEPGIPQMALPRSRMSRRPLPCSQPFAPRPATNCRERLRHRRG